MNSVLARFGDIDRQVRRLHVAVILQMVVLLIPLLLTSPCWSQELEARRWSHIPIGANLGGGGYAYTSGGVAFDPVLRLDDVRMDVQSFPMKYIRSFEMLGKSSRVEWWQAYQHAQWQGMLNGAPASTSRTGWSDMFLRVAVNLIGAPPLQGDEFAKYRAEAEVETIVGLGLVVQIPTGHYIDDRLLNLGTNRFTFRPQFGVVHNRGKWSSESTLAAWLYTDNDNFFGGRLLEQAPFYTLEEHIDYTFRPGLWAGLGLGYGLGAASTIDGVFKNDNRENLGWEASVGYPFSRQLGLKLAYIGIRTQAPVGADSDSYAAALSLLW